MKRISFAAVACLIAFHVSAQNPMKTQKDSVSYALGIDIASNLMQMQVQSDIDITLFSNAMQDVFAGKAQLSQEDAQRITQTFFMAKHEEIRAAQLKQFEVNKEKGSAFLAENAKRPEVKTTASGLQYEIVTQGTGAQPQAGDVVTLHYKGTLIDGTVFDSSIERGEPATFGVSQVIPGFSEAIQLMNVGSKYIVYIPQELAYGERGAGPIEPYSTLIFQIELLGIDSPAATATAPATTPTSTDEKPAKKAKKNK
ncbi:MAG: FKBP-type peptidyl-prolyl cis-trans isomerase [Bacteroidales bacterium]|jgi:FKBP-type peptidyl-prolyl cis-trans isomerase|nr:FKBP-type peptidyl-prolyl cis-trans isomerase [Bacteroidales bacterium]